MALFFTQCPHCQTTFRTSVSQLQSADGMVRCGACLKVFVADDNLLPSADLQTMDIPMSAEPEEKEEQEEPEERDEREPSSSVIPEVPEPIFTLETEAPGPQDIEPTFSEPGPHWEFVDDTAASDQLEEPAVEPDAEHDASAEPEIAAAAPVETSQSTSAQPGETSATPPPLRSFSALDDDFTLLREPAMAADGPAMKSEHLETLARAGDALEFDWLASPNGKPRSAWWGISAFLLVALLSAQWVYSQWYELGQNPSLRPWLMRLCETLPCSLAPMVDLQSLRSDSLVVRSHAEIANALNVTLIFRNESAFDQSLPSLNLHFMNADNEVIAARQFSPDEYLPEALANLAVLPAGAPVQVSFDIVDPGIEAINYEVSFSPQMSR